jgi:hypothetical protein
MATGMEQYLDPQAASMVVDYNACPADRTTLTP